MLTFVEVDKYLEGLKDIKAIYDTGMGLYEVEGIGKDDTEVIFLIDKETLREEIKYVKKQKVVYLNVIKKLNKIK